MLAPFSLTPALDANGHPIRTAALMVYQAGTTTPAVLYRQADYAAGTEHANPILINGASLLPAMYGSGSFRFRLLTAPGGSILWEADGVTLTDPVTVDPGAGENTGFIPTGAMIQFYATGSRAGYVRANGRTIGNASSGATERAAPDTQALYLSLWSEDDALIVAGGRGQSGQADYDAGKALALPDTRGRGLFSMDGMGAGVANAYQGVSWNTGGSSVKLGSMAGIASVTLSEANLPSHTHGASVTVAGGGGFSVDATTAQAGSNHTHSIPIQGVNVTVGGASSIFYVDPNGNFSTAFPTSSNGAAHTHSFNVSRPDHAHTASATVANTGSGVAVPIVPPLVLVTTYIKL